MNFLDLFAQKLREKREQKKITQRELAERLNMCTRTVIEIEKCKSNPKFETVALISEEMDISLDGIVFHDRAPQTSFINRYQYHTLNTSWYKLSEIKWRS